MQELCKFFIKKPSVKFGIIELGKLRSTMNVEQKNILLSLDFGSPYGVESIYDSTRQVAVDLTEIEGLATSFPEADHTTPGSKGDPITVGTVLITLLEAGAISSLVAFLSSWMSRDVQRIITLQIGENKLEVTNLSKADQQKLIDWFQKQTAFKIES
jgi:hypothetical protein